mgnify:CR=1 FL=1
MTKIERFAGLAHPRSRGENEKVTGECYPYPGSSPLTRGKLPVHIDCGVARGLIPAHAGKTTRPPREQRRGWAHPRSRGENPRPVSIFFSAGGSSPLTRGKLVRRRSTRRE